MTKRISILIIVLILSILTGCGNSKDRTPPKISKISAMDITETAVNIVWNTNEVSTSHVEYGLTGSYGMISNIDESMVKKHSITIDGLSTNTIYHYRVLSIDRYGNVAMSEDNGFISSQSLFELPQLAVYFIDVGQGDSILIDGGEVEILIDGGGKSPGVIDFLEQYVDGPLEVMVATHPHSDHIGGLLAVFDAFQIQQIWWNGDTSDTATFSEFATAMYGEDAQVSVAKRGDQITAGQLTFNILNPDMMSGDANNDSIVLRLTYGQIDFLFEGDAQQEAETSMLADDLIYPVEVLKVGHHGSRTSSSHAFLAALHPDVAVYMAGVENSYGHPHAETISALDAVGAAIYGTDMHGTISISTDGNAYHVSVSK